MIRKLKKTRLGKTLYRLSRKPGGAPLRKVAKVAQSEAFQTEHLSVEHQRHNRDQLRILAKFEKETRIPR